MLYKIVLHCKLLSSEGDTWLDELVNKGVKKKKREAFAGNNNHCRLVHWLQKQKQKQSLLVFSCEMHVPLVAKQHEEALRGVPARGVIGRSLQSLPGAWIRASWMGNTFVCLAVVLTKCVCVWTERDRERKRERGWQGENSCPRELVAEGHAGEVTSLVSWARAPHSAEKPTKKNPRSGCCNTGERRGRDATTSTEIKAH